MMSILMSTQKSKGGKKAMLRAKLVLFNMPLPKARRLFYVCLSFLSIIFHSITPSNIFLNVDKHFCPDSICFTLNHARKPVYMNSLVLADMCVIQRACPMDIILGHGNGVYIYFIQSIE